MSRHLSTRNISSKSMHAFLSNLAQRQTHERGRASEKERIVLREIHLRTTGTHLSMGSQCYLPPDRGDLHPKRAGWYSIYRPRKDERYTTYNKAQLILIRSTFYTEVMRHYSSLIIMDYNALTRILLCAWTTEC